MKKINPYLYFFLSIAVTAGICFGIKQLEYNLYFMLIGFRVYLPLLIPVIFIILRQDYSIIKKAVVNFEYKKKWYVFVVLLVFIALNTAFYFITKYKFSEPDYFYELGLSSIIDFPLYLVWNLPILLSVYILFFYIEKELRFNFFFILFTIIVLLALEYYPFEFKMFNLAKEMTVLAYLVFLILLFYKVRNSILFVVISFAVMWFTLLLYGSESVMLINLFLAKNFDEWEGFVKTGKGIWEYLPALNIVIISLFSLLIRNSPKKKAENSEITGISEKG